MASKVEVCSYAAVIADTGIVYMRLAYYRRQQTADKTNPDFLRSFPGN
ncbi:MAG: hypothetical protein ACQERO_09795 [Bacteroidota bacterium]